ncbi:MAG: hypothetical protein ACLGH8_02555 [Bacteroidia bacterium]
MRYLKLLLILPSTLLLQGCWGWGTGREDDMPPQSAYRAVTMPRDVFENAITLTAAKPVYKAGKIYIKDNLMFVTEVNKGFHIYDYTDPANPRKKAFLEIAGATDVAIRGNNLYINQAVDLVTLVYDNNQITLGGRTRNIFPQKASPDGHAVSIANNYEIIVDYIPR